MSYDPRIPIANACELNVGSLSRSGTYLPEWHESLFLMWASPSNQAYVWARSFEDAFEEFVEYLDDKKLCGPFVTLGIDELKEAADDIGVAWQSNWPDSHDRYFQDVLEHAEQDLTLIGHTTLRNCGPGPHYIPSYDWGGDEILDSNIVLAVARASVKECWKHTLLPGDEVYVSSDQAEEWSATEANTEPVAGRYVVASINGDDVDIENEDRNYFTNVPAVDLPRFNPQTHKARPQAKTESGRMMDFFFGKKPLPPSSSSGGFLGLDSFHRKGRRR